MPLKPKNKTVMTNWREELRLLLAGSVTEVGMQQVFDIVEKVEEDALKRGASGK